ncbi:MAG: iron ABC transporter permease [Deltaproteobacteria bacterium]|nr:iron ABC transporter permease [Deltaproteobacteria bacterium]
MLVTLAALLAAALAAGLVVGPSALGPGEALRALLDPGAAGPAGDIVRRIRLPRVAAAALVGASLSLAGVCFQALLRNPLADPFVLGISGGAALAGVAVLSLGAAIGAGAGLVPIAAFAGALGATALLFGVAGWRGRLSATTLLLTGVVFNAFASAAIVFLASLGGLSEGTSIFLWLIGTLAAAPPQLLAALAGLLAAGLACALPLARALDLLALGEDGAAQLGVAVERTKRLVLLATALVVGGAVSVSGLIGFVGLVVPHALRLLFGPDHRLLVPASVLGGGAFLVACDTLARTLLPGRELPVGAITALLGGPLFLVLLRRQGGRGFLP